MSGRNGGQFTQPLEAVRSALGTRAELREIACDPQLWDRALWLDLGPLEPEARERWRRFAARFTVAWREASVGPALLLRDDAVEGEAAEGTVIVAWNDMSIWADFHAPETRKEPERALATALAVELCGWRLDLAAALVPARREDLLDPLRWLIDRGERPGEVGGLLDGRPFACPLALLANGDRAALSQRVWRARLFALFPWLEERRLYIAERYAASLRIGEEEVARGYASVDELEFGALCAQLGYSLGTDERAVLNAFRIVRNELARRRPTPAEALAIALTRHKEL